ncbi:MAG: threonine-phosphate decarboxylase [Nitrospira sp.]|nr:threonine-phosphate decarboxylase [Nitrospira sp.]
MNRQAHGGDVYAAARELKRNVRHLLDFSASINPLGPSPAAWRAIGRGSELLSHYPDPACRDLRQALATFWDRSPEEFLIGNGSTELIHLLPEALQIRHLLVIGPTFSEYAAAMARVGGQISSIMATRDDGYRPPLEQALDDPDKFRNKRNRMPPVDAVMLCNPNSPTGQACDAVMVRKLARRAARLGQWCLVDETFAEYCEQVSILPEDLPARTLVLRSFTKFYGLPGLRVGYAVGNPKVIKQVSAHQPPWSVNMLAQRAAQLALQDRRHSRRSLRFIEQERSRLVQELRRLPGCSTFPSAANFLLVELPARLKAARVVSALRRQGILVRDCSQVPGLNDRSIRLAVRSRADNDRLLNSLSKIIGNSRV